MDLSTALTIAQIVAYIAAPVIFIVLIKERQDALTEAIKPLKDMPGDIRIIRHDMGALQIRQDALNDAFRQLTEILTRVAVQDERIKALEDDIRDLRRGKGWIKD